MSGKRRAGAHNSRQQSGQQDKMKKQKISVTEGLSSSKHLSSGHKPDLEAVPMKSQGGTEQHRASNSESPSELDPDDLQAIAETLQASTRQEERIATETLPHAVQPVVPASLAAGVTHRTDRPSMGPEVLQKKASHASARDHVAKGQSDHMPRATHKQVYGSSATSFAELGLNEVCSISCSL